MSSKKLNLGVAAVALMAALLVPMTTFDTNPNTAAGVTMMIDSNAGTIEYMLVSSAGMIASTIASVTAIIVGIDGSIEN